MNILKKSWRATVFTAALLALTIGLMAADFYRVQATDLPVINKSGVLAENQIWTNDNVYVVNGTLEIPYGTTLTIEAGTIIKLSGTNDYHGININGGGQLVANGTAQSPVTFTSTRDDSVGGDSMGDGPTVGMTDDYYSAITAHKDSKLTLNHAVVRNAKVGVGVYCRYGSGARATIADSQLDSQVSIDACPPQTISLVRNGFNVPNREPIDVRNSSVDNITITGINKNTFAGSNKSRVVKISDGYIPEGTIWTVSSEDGAVILIDKSMDVRSGGTLNVSAGTIIKINHTSLYGAITVSGVLNISGSSQSPVTLTSYRDDSIGGDSDGSVSSPAVNDYATAIEGRRGQITVTHASIRYASKSLWVSCSTQVRPVSIFDSLLYSTVEADNCRDGMLSLERNVFAVEGGQAMYLKDTDISNIIMSGAGKNEFIGTGRRVVVALDRVFLPSGRSWTASGEGGATFVDVGGLSVSGSLEIKPGTVFKLHKNIYRSEGIYIEPGGMLAAGSAAGAPVIFTSLKDDSIAGDSGGDGPTTSGPTDYTTAVSIHSGASATVVNTVMSNADRAVRLDCHATNVYPVNLEDNIFKSSVEINNCLKPSSVSIKRNTFAVAADFALTAELIDLSNIVLSGPDKNIFSGSGRQATVKMKRAFIGAGQNAAFTSAYGATIMLDHYLVNEGSLTIEAGTRVKMGNEMNPDGILQISGSSLAINGTDNDPVIITSVRDDSIGGDTLGDGPTVGAAGNYRTALSAGQATLAINGAEIRYADTAIRAANSQINASGKIHHVNYGIVAQGSAKVTYRGSFSDVGEKAVRSCNWEDSCNVDAGYVDWGRAEGPFASSGDLACGNVNVSPWKTGSTTQSGQVFTSRNCFSNSRTPHEKYSDSVQAYNQRLNQKSIDCSGGMQDACDQIQRMFNCVDAAIGLATANSPFPLPGSSATEAAGTYMNAMLDGASTYVEAAVEPSPATFTLNVASRIAQVGSIWQSLASAYNSCQ